MAAIEVEATEPQHIRMVISELCEVEKLESIIDEFLSFVRILLICVLAQLVFNLSEEGCREIENRMGRAERIGNKGKELLFECIPRPLQVAFIEFA